MRYETTARRIVRDMQAYMGGDMSRWATVQSIARRLELHNQDLIDRAIIHAYECGWIDIQGLHSVKLTNECRRLFVKALKR